MKTMTSNPYQELDRIIGMLDPRHASTKRPIPGEADRPERMRQLWDAVGLSHATEAALESAPSRDRSESELRQIFDKWSADPKSRQNWNTGGDPQAFRKALPERSRLVYASDDKVAVTDEGVESPDPPVLLMRAARTPVIPWHAHYSEWLIWRLISRLTVTRSTAYNRAGQLPTERVLAGLYPELHELREGIWWIRVPSFSPTGSSPLHSTMVFYASLEDYLAFVFGLPDDKLVYMRGSPMSSIAVKARGPLNLFAGIPEGFRVFKTIGFNGRPELATNALGRVGDTIVRLGGTEKDDQVHVRYNPTKRDVVLAWLKELKVSPEDEEPLPPGYDEYGW